MIDAEQERSDEEVIRSVLEGKREAFAFLVRKYQNRVFALGLRFFRNREDAHDFVQEVFFRVFERLASFRGEARFATWLMKVAYYHGISSRRTRKSAESLPEEAEPVSSASGPERLHAMGAAKDALIRAMGELPERYRICLDLYFSFGMTYEDVATVTDIPVGTVKSHVFRAKQALRTSLRGTAAEGHHEV